MKFDLPPTINKLPVKRDYWEFEGFHRHLVYTRSVFIYHRSRASEAQNHRCCWCGVMTTDQRGFKNSSTVEHVTPRSKGGLDHPDNYAMACHECNNKRKSSEVDEFMNFLDTQKMKPPSVKDREMRKKARKRFNRLHQDNAIVFG